VAVDACRNLVDYLAGRDLRNTVNIPAIDFATLGALRPCVELGHRMGVLLATLMRGRLKRLEVTLAGDITDVPYGPITTGVVIGILERIVQGTVNMVNALVVARENGLDVSERTDSDARGYASSIRVAVEGDRESHAVHGTVFQRDDPRITMLDGFEIELAPEGDLVITFHEDRPGVIGEVGTTLGRHQINIASMACGRKVETQEACLGLTLDSVPSDAVLDELRGKTFMKHVYYISLPPLVTEGA
jgi:D-3-phosphoglycerate dehydrogenase